MSVDHHFAHLSTEEVVKRFKAAALQGQPSRELIDALANRPGIAFINATDSKETTLEKARGVIQRVEEANV